MLNPKVGHTNKFLLFECGGSYATGHKIHLTTRKAEVVPARACASNGIRTWATHLVAVVRVSISLEQTKQTRLEGLGREACLGTGNRLICDEKLGRENILCVLEGAVVSS